MDSVGPCSPCRNVWIQSFLLLLSSLSSCVAVLRNHVKKTSATANIIRNLG
jgi:hypothetical protein